MLHLITPFSHDSIHKMAKFISNRKHDRNTVILLVGYQTSVPQTEDLTFELKVSVSYGWLLLAQWTDMS